MSAASGRPKQARTVARQGEGTSVSTAGPVTKRRAARDIDTLSPFQRFYLLFVVLAAVGPFIPLLIASFSFRWTWPNLLPSSWWWSARDTVTNPISWDYVFSPESRVWTATRNTLIIACSVTVLCLLVSLPAARVIAREKFRGKEWIEFFLITPLIVPEIAVGLGILVIFLHLGLAGSFFGVIVALLIPTIPYMVRILTSVFQGLSRDFEEQAQMLGARPLQVLWHVTIPMIMPGVLGGCLFAFLISSNVFLLTFFISRGGIETLPTLLFSRLSGGGSLDAISAGIALVVSLPGFALLVITERFIKDEVFAIGVK